MVSSKAQSSDTPLNNPSDTTPEEMRPIAVHVEEITYNVNLRHIHRRRVAVVDLELTKEHITDLVKNLQERLSKERGTIRVRFKGRMVLE